MFSLFKRVSITGTMSVLSNSLKPVHHCFPSLQVQTYLLFNTLPHLQLCTQFSSLQRTGCRYACELCLLPQQPAFLWLTNDHCMQGHSIDIKIKWPNDIYCKNLKIGGILCHSTYRSKEFQVVIGVGLNLDNSEPTTCVNDLLRQRHEELQLQSGVQAISREVCPAFLTLALSRTLHAVLPWRVPLWQSSCMVSHSPNCSALSALLCDVANAQPLVVLRCTNLRSCNTYNA